jgi:hypothetical protein
MNEKIKQLAEQAFEESSKELAVTDPARWYSDKGPDIDILFQQKFAELIVRECIGILEPKSRYTGEGPEVLKDKIRQIKKHFGVAE